jgi:hypothetical protein
LSLSLLSYKFEETPRIDSGDLGGDRYMNVETILTVPWLMRQQVRERERELSKTVQETTE